MEGPERCFVVGGFGGIMLRAKDLRRVRLKQVPMKKKSRTPRQWHLISLSELDGTEGKAGEDLGVWG